MGFEQVIDNLTFKCMDALRKQIQSLVDVWSYCFWIHAMVSKFRQRLNQLNYFRSPVWFAVISTRGMTLVKAFFYFNLPAFCISSNLGVSGFSCCIFFIFKDN